MIHFDRFDVARRKWVASQDMVYSYLGDLSPCHFEKPT